MPGGDPLPQRRVPGRGAVGEDPGRVALERPLGSGLQVIDGDDVDGRRAARERDLIKHGPQANPGILAHSRHSTRGSWTVPDIDEVGAMIGSGSVAAVLVYEELVIFPLIAAWRRGGARVVAEGQISPEDIVLALDATKSN